jgi:methyl-accepting chemotaxis protein
MKIGNLKIGVRLAAGLCVSIIFMVGIAGIGVRNLGKLNDNTRDLAVDKVPKVILAYETIGGLNDIARAMRNAILSTDPAVVKAELERVDKRKAENAVRLQQLGKLIDDDDDKDSKTKLQAVLGAREKYLLVQTSFVNMSADQSKREQAIVYLLSTVRKEQTAYMNALTDMVKFQTAAIEDTSAVAEHAYATSRNMIIVMTLVAAVLSGWVLWWITRSITQPLNRAVGMAKAVAGGDLTMRMQSDTTDETGQLLTALI